jgi:hypothetical protein
MAKAVASKVEEEASPSESPALAVAQQLKLWTPKENRLGFILEESKSKIT